MLANQEGCMHAYVSVCGSMWQETKPSMTAASKTVVLGNTIQSQSNDCCPIFDGT